MSKQGEAGVPEAQPPRDEGAGEEGLAGMVAEVLSPRCDGCGDCAEHCPAVAIAVYALAAIDPWACTGCGRCVAACPRQAITMRRA